MFYRVFHIPFKKSCHKLYYIAVLQGTGFTPQHSLNMAIGSNRLAYTIFLQYVCARFDKKNIRYAAHTNG
jgi:hypothetical protein